VTVAKYPAVTAVGASVALDMALALASTSSSSPSLADQFVDDQHLVDEVVQEFDVTHHLSELSAAWANLTAHTASFGELLQVNAFSFSLPFFLIWCPSFFFPSLSYFPSSLCKAFSQDQSSFFGSREFEKKLVFEVNRLKVELVLKQVDLEVER
jgi:hypothetical protein